MSHHEEKIAIQAKEQERRERELKRLAYALSNYKAHAQEVLSLQNQAGQRMESQEYKAPIDPHLYNDLVRSLQHASPDIIVAKSLDVELQTQRILAKRIALTSLLQAWDRAQREEKG